MTARWESGLALLVVILLTVLGLLSPRVPDAAAEGARDYGFQLRIRQVFLDNARDLDDSVDDEMHFFRIRSALWGRVRPTGNTEIYVRLNNEFRRYFHPDVDFEIDEVIFENLYLRWANVAGLPLELTLGRQNIMLGEGFLVMDGGPLDGSRTIYQNAVRLTWRTPSNVVDVIGISNPSKDEYLPIINDQDRTLVESDERLAGIHVSNTRLRGLEFQPYYFYKEEDPRPASPHHLRLHSPGARLAYEITPGLRIVAEAAVQRGSRCGARVSASGGYVYLQKRSPSDKEGISFGALSLSGLHNDTADPWNPLLSRWPKWSELYIYTLAGETGVAYWQNLEALFAKLDGPVTGRGAFSACAYHLAAYRSQPGFLASHDRGWLLESQLQFRLHPRVRGHMLAEAFLPGDFYSEPIMIHLDKPALEGQENSTAAFSGGGAGRAIFLRWELLFDF